MRKFKPDLVLLDPEVENWKEVDSYRREFSGIPFQVGNLPKGPLPTAKNDGWLYLTKYPGRFLKLCPGCMKENCCNYLIISPVENCHLGCSYCILQEFLSSPVHKIYLNINDLEDELKKLTAQEKGKVLRIGTGDMADSLALESITSYAEGLVKIFSRQSGAILELKTKSNEVDSLLKLNPQGNTMVSWSLAPQKIVSQEEKNTASISERLEAAKKCQEKGYLIGIHFDPILSFPGWKKAYEELAEEIFEVLNPDSIVWISMGGLRYGKELKRRALRRHPDSKIFSEKMEKDEMGKIRYPFSKRLEMYRFLKHSLCEHFDDLFIYLCMEENLMWEQAMGFSYASNAAFAKAMDNRLLKIQKRIQRGMSLV